MRKRPYYQNQVQRQQSGSNTRHSFSPLASSKRQPNHKQQHAYYSSNNATTNDDPIEDWKTVDDQTIQQHLKDEKERFKRGRYAPLELHSSSSLSSTSQISATHIDTSTHNNINIGGVGINQVIQQHYDRKHIEHSPQERYESPIIKLRTVHNKIKDELIKDVTHRLQHHFVSVERFDVLDLCCGRGQDVFKYLNTSRFRNWVGFDLSPGEISEAKKRIDSEIQHSTTTKSFPHVASFNAFAYVRDCHALHGCVDTLPMEQQFHLVSCQFAVHYSLQSEERCKGLLNNVISRLLPGGYFICSFLNRARVLERFTSSLHSGSGRIGNSIYSIQINASSPSPSSSSLTSCATDQPSSMYAHRYHFNLKDTIDCPEYFVPLSEWLTLCKEEFHLHLIETKPFKNYLENISHQGRSLSLSMEEQELCVLYDTHLFQFRPRSSSSIDESKTSTTSPLSQSIQTSSFGQLVHDVTYKFCSAEELFPSSQSYLCSIQTEIKNHLKRVYRDYLPEFFKVFPTTLTRMVLASKILSNEDYWVSEKSDGERCLLWCQYSPVLKKPLLVLINRKWELIDLTHTSWNRLTRLGNGKEDFLLDGELVTIGHLESSTSSSSTTSSSLHPPGETHDEDIKHHASTQQQFIPTSEKQYRIFDVIILHGSAEISQVRQYSKRIEALRVWLGDLSLMKDVHSLLRLKEFIRVRDGPRFAALLKQIKKISELQYVYDDGQGCVTMNDGLIFTPEPQPYFLPLHQEQQQQITPLVIYKWKFCILNTIDAACSFFPPQSHTMSLLSSLSLSASLSPSPSSSHLIRVDLKAVADRGTWVCFKHTFFTASEVKQILDAYSSSTHQHQRGYIVEVYRSMENGQWRVKTPRLDKHEPNHIQTVCSVLEVLADNITSHDIIEALQHPF